MRNMTRRGTLSLLMAAAFVRPAFAKGAGVSTNRAGVAIQGYDTHAYWAKDTAQVGDKAFVVDWQRVPWRFATQEDADLFAPDPGSFAPKFGGFCTRAMSLKKVINGDPEVWRIFDRNLYLFARPVGREYFDKGEVAMIAKAQAYWDTLG